MKIKESIPFIVTGGLIVFAFAGYFIIDAVNPKAQLMNGVSEGNLEKVKKAVESGAKELDLALSIASGQRANREEIIRYLVGNGANVEALGPFSATPLMCAVREENIEHVTLLLSLGADKTINVQEPLNGFSALMWTTSSDVGDDMGLALMNILIAHGPDLHLKDKKGNTILMLAEKKGNMEMIKYLKNML